MYVAAFDLYSRIYFYRTTILSSKALLKLESPFCAFRLYLIMQHIDLVDAVADKNGKWKRHFY